MTASHALQRIAVIGNAASGKSTLARALAERLGLRYIERDALVWRAGWTATPRAERVAVFDAATREGGWAYDGHLRADRPEEQIVLARCDTIVWLNPPRWRATAAALARSLRRALTREPLVNGNVEGWRMILNPDFGACWAWRMHARLQLEYRTLFASYPGDRRALIELHSRAEARRWLGTLPVTIPAP